MAGKRNKIEKAVPFLWHHFISKLLHMIGENNDDTNICKIKKMAFLLHSKTDSLAFLRTTIIDTVYVYIHRNTY